MSGVRSRVGISLPMLNQPARALQDLAHLADESGFDSLWDYEFFRNPFITHAVNAGVTENIALATGIATAASRSPFEMANAAADVDELSGGRAILGLGLGAEGWTDIYNGADLSHPLPRIREYVTGVRAVWDHFATGDNFSVDGKYVTLSSPVMNPWGGRELARPRIPIYMGAVKPGMLRLAGELADGVIGYLNTPAFIEGHIRPHLAEGAARVGRDSGGIDIASLIICAISADRERARRIARINVGNYVAFPGSWPVVEYMGLQDERDAVLQALLTDGIRALESATSDRLLEAFAICGTPDEALEQFAAFDGLLPHIVLHTPYVPPISGADSQHSFRAVCETFAKAFVG